MKDPQRLFVCLKATVKLVQDKRTKALAMVCIDA